MSEPLEPCFTKLGFQKRPQALAEVYERFYRELSECGGTSRESRTRQKALREAKAQCVALFVEEWEKAGKEQDGNKIRKQQEVRAF